MEKAKNIFIWGYFDDVEDLRQQRQRTLEDCTRDITKAIGRYVPVTRPSLPFEDGEFDLIYQHTSYFR